MKMRKLISGLILFFALFIAVYAGVKYFKSSGKKSELIDHNIKKSPSNLLNQAKTVSKAKNIAATTPAMPDGSKQKNTTHKRKLKFNGFRIGIPNPNSSDYDCVLTNKYTLAQRLIRYPFSKAVKIVVVSFRYMDRRRDILINDSVKIIDDSIRSKLPDSLLNKSVSGIKYESGLHIENNQLNYSSIIEIVNLNRGQIGGLTNIIYNTKKRKPSHFADPGYSCYSPRNALIFYDKNGRIFDYLEICFECKQYRSLSEKIDIGSDCNQEFDLLKTFFIDAGINFGTIKKD